MNIPQETQPIQLNSVTIDAIAHRVVALLKGSEVKIPSQADIITGEEAMKILHVCRRTLVTLKKQYPYISPRGKRKHGFIRSAVEELAQKRKSV